mgnify:CR=1
MVSVSFLLVFLVLIVGLSALPGGHHARLRNSLHLQTHKDQYRNPAWREYVGMI